MSKKLRKNVLANESTWLLRVISAAAAMMLVTLVSRPIPARADAAAAASNYKDSCVDCHGETGKGDGKKAKDLKTKPANYTDCAAMAKLDDDYLFKITKEGGEAMGKGKGMPDFGKAYDDEEIHDLVAYVRSFCKK